MAIKIHYKQEASNQPPAPVPQHACAFKIKLSETAVGYVTKPFCDKIKLVGDLTPEGVLSAKPAKFLTQICMSATKTLEDNSTAGLFRKPKKSTKGFATGYISVGNQQATILVGIRKPKDHPEQRRVFFEFNPSKLGQTGASDLHGIWEVLFHENVSFAKWLRDAEITMYHAAIDVVGIPFLDLLIRPSKGALSFDPSAKAPGKFTTYASGKQHMQTLSQFNNHVKAKVIFSGYNKGRQLKETGEPTLYGNFPHARLERRLHRVKNRRFVDIASLPNPFCQTTISHLPTAGQGLAHEWRLFVDSACLRGVDGALEFVATENRTSWETALVDGPQLFNMDEAWKQWPQHLDHSALGNLVAAACKQTKP